MNNRLFTGLMAAVVGVGVLAACNSPTTPKPQVRDTKAAHAVSTQRVTKVDCPFAEAAVATNRDCAVQAREAAESLQQGIEAQYGVPVAEQDGQLRIYLGALERFEADWRTWTASLDTAAWRDAGQALAAVSAAQGKAENALLHLQDMVNKGYSQ